MHVNDSKTTDPKAPRLLVAMEMSLKTWRLAMAVKGQPKKRVKTVEAGHYLELTQAMADAKERFTLPEATPVVFCYEAGRDGFYPYRRLTELGHEVWSLIRPALKSRRSLGSDLVSCISPVCVLVYSYRTQADAVYRLPSVASA